MHIFYPLLQMTSVVELLRRVTLAFVQYCACREVQSPLAALGTQVSHQNIAMLNSAN